jgi:endonuclease/exonuclease/phosphatase family metal-dependent hydrolase
VVGSALYHHGDIGAGRGREQEATMPKAFSVASWNVEHFKGKPERTTRVVEFLNESRPDIFALYEVTGAEVFGTVTTSMPKYSFHITEGPQTQEILVGVKNNLTAFFTQKIAFRAGVSLLRPGALLTVRVAEENYSLLFLHTKSGTDPRGLGLRDDMLVRACKFQSRLNKASEDGLANYMFMGDLNTMGMKYTYVRAEDIEAENELKRLDRLARFRKMRRLEKDEIATWWGGGTLPPSNLDHVVASNQLEFRQFGGADVTVRGWPKRETEAQQRQWIDRFSDHGLLYFEVQRV